MSLRILIAEDNALNRKVLLAFLEQLGHQAGIAEDGHGVVEAVKRTDYDVILMDIRMPGLNGIEAARAVRAMGDDVKQPYVIAVTASAMSDDYSQFEAVGINDILIKPLGLSELRAGLDRMPGAA